MSKVAFIGLRSMGSRVEAHLLSANSTSSLHSNAHEHETAPNSTNVLSLERSVSKNELVGCDMGLREVWCAI